MRQSVGQFVGHFGGHCFRQFKKNWGFLLNPVLDFVCKGFNCCQRIRLLYRGETFVKGCDFHGRMLVEWKEASGALDVDFCFNGVWVRVGGCGLWTRLWPCGFTGSC